MKAGALSRAQQQSLSGWYIDDIEIVDLADTSPMPTATSISATATPLPSATPTNISPTATPIPSATPTTTPSPMPSPTQAPTATPLPQPEGIEQVLLIDVATDTVIQTLPVNGEVTTINRSAYPAGFNLAIETSDGIRSIGFATEIVGSTGHSWSLYTTDNGAPFAYCQLSDSDYQDCALQYRLLPNHTYHIQAIPYGGQWASGPAYEAVDFTLVVVNEQAPSPTPTPEPTAVATLQPTATPAPPAPQITQVYLIEAGTNSIVETIPINGETTVINRALYDGGINLLFETSDGAKSYRSETEIISGMSQWTMNLMDNTAPFTYCNQINSDYSDCATRYLLLPNTTYRIKATAYSGQWSSGVPSNSVEFTLVIIDMPN